jgi:hypothetical protein
MRPHVFAIGSVEATAGALAVRLGTVTFASACRIARLAQPQPELEEILSDVA